MKLKKRIAAMGAAMVMAVSMMSIGASADTVNFSLNKSTPSFSRNATVTTTNQEMHLSTFSRVGSSNASVTLYNNVSSSFTRTWSSAPQTAYGNAPVSSLGTTVTVGAYLNNYSSATSVSATGYFKT